MPFSAAALRNYSGIMREAFRAVTGRDGSAWEIQAACAVAWLETGFGTWWKAPGCKGGRNWGAVQTAKTSCCYTTDHHPNGAEYRVHFVCYESDLEGAKGLVQFIQRGDKSAWNAARSGDLASFSEILWRMHYFGGSCSPYPAGSEDCRRKVIRDHALGLRRYARELAAANGEPAIPLGELPPEPGSSQGSGASASSLGAFVLVGVSSLAILALTLRKR